MMLNLGGIVLSMATDAATVNRYARQTFDTHGKAYARLLLSSFSANLSVQPISGVDRKLLPEGINESEAVSIWSSVNIALRDQIVVVARGTFEVVHVDPWQAAGGYCKVIARKLDASEVIS